MRREYHSLVKKRMCHLHSLNPATSVFNMASRVGLCHLTLIPCTNTGLYTDVSLVPNTPLDSHGQSKHFLIDSDFHI